MSSNREKALWLKAKSIVSESGCWEWAAGKHGAGYGVVPSKFHKSRYAHRAMYEAVIGEIPLGLYVLHSCDNRACINPEHLRAGTHLENIRDMQAKNRHKGGSMPNEENPWCKFSDKTISAIRDRARLGVSKGLIEREFGISETHYYRIIRNQSRSISNA